MSFASEAEMPFDVRTEFISSAVVPFDAADSFRAMAMLPFQAVLEGEALVTPLIRHSEVIETP